MELNKAGQEHLSFNSAMLKVLLEAADWKTASFFAEKAHGESVLRAADVAHRVAHIYVPVVSGFRRRFVWKFLVEAVMTAKVLIAARRNDARVVFLSMFPNVLALLVASSRLWTAGRISVVLHGEVEALRVQEKQAISKEGFWAKLALLKLYRNWPELFILGSGLKARLLEAFPDSKQIVNLRVIEHPYVFVGESLPAVRTGGLRIGFIGTGRRIKGIEDFFTLADRLVEHVQSGALEFVVVGGVEAGVVKSPNVTVMAEEMAGLPSESYFSAIGSLDIAVFPYRQDYRFIASGAVFDAISKNVEIWSLENPYFRDIANDDQEGGIRFFQSVLEMEAALSAMLSSKKTVTRPRYPLIRLRYSYANQSSAFVEPHHFGE